jgi:hypothetical protein
MGDEHVSPAMVAELRRLPRRVHDVREHHRREHTVRLRAAADARQELLDLVQNRVGVGGERQVILAVQLDVLRPGNALCHVASELDRYRPIAVAVDDERRHPYRREHVADVDLRVHLHERPVGARTRARAQQASPPVAEARVPVQRRRADVEADRPAPLAGVPLEDAHPLLARRAPGVVGRGSACRRRDPRDRCRACRRGSGARTTRGVGGRQRASAPPRTPRGSTPSPERGRGRAVPRQRPGRRC